MRSVGIAIAIVTIAPTAALTIAAAVAQTPTDHVKLSVTRAELQVIGQGLMELPYKTSAPIMNDLQAQLNAADQAAAKAAVDAAKPKEEKPAEGNPDKGAGPMIPAAKTDEPTK
jgi:hypothetical protein